MKQNAHVQLIFSASGVQLYCMTQPKHFIVFDIVPPHTPPELSERGIAETISLIHTLTGGSAVIKHIVQQRTHPHPSTFIGTGKLEEIVHMVGQDKIDAIVINNLVKPGQIFELTKRFWNEYPDLVIWDRVDLILQIFKKHAHTAESKLQIEIAAMGHMGPRIFGMGMVLSRQGGGVGNRGIGETNTERMKRHWRDELKKTEKKLEALQKDRQVRMEKRKNDYIKTVALVGYTNAGKTSLFNALTGKQKLSKDVLFATLDSVTGSLHIPYTESHRSGDHVPKILVADTIGFMSGLPPALITAFRSTLTETTSADLILHVVDASDEKIEEKMTTVNETLHELGTDHIEKLVVYTKTDLAPNAHIDTVKRVIKTTPGILIAKDDPTSIANLVHAIVATCK